MNLQESFKSRIIRLSIPVIVLVIIGIYYLSEIRPFPYQQYEKHINQLQRYDAELNEAVVLIRFGIIKFYDPIVQAENKTDEVIAILSKSLEKNPNPKIQEKFNIVLATMKSKREMTAKFERINPILINAIIHFSNILGQIIESESNNKLIEGQLDLELQPSNKPQADQSGKPQQIDQAQLEQDAKTQQIDKANLLYRGILIYVLQRSEAKHDDLINLVKELRTSPDKLPKIDSALMYADKILELQPQMSKIDESFFQVPIVPTLNELHEAYNEEFKNFESLGDKFRIILFSDFIYQMWKLLIYFNIHIFIRVFLWNCPNTINKDSIFSWI